MIEKQKVVEIKEVKPKEEIKEINQKKKLKK
jgi:hypothetical protein